MKTSGHLCRMTNCKTSRANQATKLTQNTAVRPSAYASEFERMSKADILYRKILKQTFTN